MKYLFTFLLLITATFANLKTGDLVFCDFPPPVINPGNGEVIGTLGPMIKTVTGSNYTHCGIIKIEDGITYVIEAIQPVQKITLESWSARVGGNYDSYRFRRFVPRRLIRHMIAEAETHIGEDYDWTWVMGNDAVNCTEIIWEPIFAKTGKQMCPAVAMGSLNVMQPADDYTLALFGLPPNTPYAVVLGILGFSLEQTIVTPGDLANSCWLRKIDS
jgi:hypothetical protein